MLAGRGKAFANVFAAVILAKPGAAGGGICGPMSTQATSSKKRSNVPLCSWGYWQQWTDVTQIEVKDRIVASLNPIKPVFKIIVDTKPDIYGPFWLATLF